MKALVLKINPDRPEKKKMKIAAEAIRKGRLVVFPTETVYGIGASAFDKRACARIFKVKGRASDNPLIVHVSSLKMAEEIGSIPQKYRKIIKKIWPSPITFIVKAKGRLPKSVTAGLDTVAIRMPSSKVALELIRFSGLPIAAPSANISKKPSSTSATHALKYFKDSVDIIIDSGRSRFGLESTILDLRDFRLLRPGSFTVEEIEESFGKRPLVTGQTKGIKESERAISPGMKYRHYSPDTALFLFEGNADKLKRIIKSSHGFAFIGSKETAKRLGRISGRKIILGSRKNARELARNLFDALIRLDSMGVKFAIAESFSEKGYGLAIMNRLRKASEHKSFRNSKELGTLLKSIS